MQRKSGKFVCQCPLGLIPHFYRMVRHPLWRNKSSVNALSGLYLISTRQWRLKWNSLVDACQCPLGLIPHFYISMVRVYDHETSRLCQCPLGLIPHFYIVNFIINDSDVRCVNALSGLYLISTVPLQKPRF